MSTPDIKPAATASAGPVAEPERDAAAPPPAKAGLGSRLGDLLSDAAIYGASSMLSRIIGFLLLPLLTEYLSAKEFGIMAMLTLITTVYVPVANLGMTNAIFRRFNFCNDRDERRVVLGTGLASVVSSSIVLLCLTLLIAHPLAESIVGDVNTVGLVQISLLATAISAVGAVPRIVLRAARRVRMAAALTVAQVVFSVIPTIWFIVVGGQGVRGVVLGDLIGTIVTTALAFYCTRSEFGMRLDSGAWKSMLRYGLPFVPHHVQAVLLGMFGQYVVREMLGLGEAGLYAVATKFALPVAFVVNSVHASWVPYKFQIAAEDADPKPFFRSTLLYYVAAISYLWVGVSMWGPEMVRLMTQADFHPAAMLVWAVALIPLAQGLYFMLGTGIEVSDRTAHYPMISLVGLIAAVAATYAIVPLTGAFGAALATACGYLVMSVAVYYVSQQKYAIRYDWTTLGALALAAVAFVVIGQWIQPMPLVSRLLAAVGLSLAYPVVAFLLLLRSRHERNRMLRLWEAWQPFRGQASRG